MSGPVTSVARVEDVHIFLKDPVYKMQCLEVSLTTHIWVVRRQTVKQVEVREAGLFDKARLGRPVTATDESCQERFEEMAQENHGII